jgi:hypothetical protein
VSLTHYNAEEMLLVAAERDDSVVIKRPMSSKKSKSLENVNKLLNSRKSSACRGIIDIYKR